MLQMIMACADTCAPRHTGCAESCSLRYLRYFLRREAFSFLVRAPVDRFENSPLCLSLTREQENSARLHLSMVVHAVLFFSLQINRGQNISTCGHCRRHLSQHVQLSLAGAQQ